jgi:hypothetical protein
MRNKELWKAGRRVAEEWRIYAVGIMVSRAARDVEGDLSIWYQLPGILFARSKAEAVSQTFSRAHEQYPESEGYSNHQAVALEVTADFLELAAKLDKPPAKDARRGEHALMGEAVETDEEIATDTETPM